MLRHSLATSLLRQGGALDEIGELLRHRSPKHEVGLQELISGIAQIPWMLDGMNAKVANVSACSPR
jgi:hypothetical protein